MSIYNVHGGHSLQCRGASGFLDEVNEDRKVKNKVIELLRAAGHTVYDCTDDIGRTQGQNLNNIKNKCNVHNVDLDISIHLNSGRNDPSGDEKTGGVEVWNYNDKTAAISDRICDSISTALSITNRGSKYTHELYILNNTKAPALLVECCFVDDKDDYNHWDADKCAEAIVAGITGGTVKHSSSTASVKPTPVPTIPAQSTTKIDVIHQVFASGIGWLSEVTNYNTNNANGYSGAIGHPMLGFRAKTKGDAATVGYLKYRAHKKGYYWFGWRTDYNKDNSGDTFAGTCKSEIDGLQFCIDGVKGRHVKYRVHTKEDGWLAWVTDYGEGSNGYAGVYGHAIDAVQIEII